MKKRVVLTGLLSIFMLFGTVEESNAQFGKFLKKALKKKGGSSSKRSSKKGAKPGAFTDLNNHKDSYGVSGEYVDVNGAAHGFKFVTEEEGKLINKLFYWEKKTDNPQLKLNLKEKFFRKNKVKFFFVWNGAHSNSYIEVLELAPGVLVHLSQDKRSLNAYDKIVPLEVKRKAVEVFVKNKADLETWDLETAQAKADMIFASLNSEQIEKDIKKLMRFDAYKNYRGKIAFANYPSALRSSKDKQPVEKVANFITKRELGETVGFKPYFDKPLAISHPGAWFNITYEMAGVKTDREALRKTSTKFSKSIPRLDKWLNDFYFYYPKVTINRSNNVADYAFLELLRLTQDKLKQGQVYDLKVTVWAHKDGENVDPVAKGMIQLEYTKNTEKLLLDPTKGWITVLENYLDE